MNTHRSRDRRQSLLIAWGILASLLIIAASGVAVSADTVRYAASSAGNVNYVPNEYIVRSIPGATAAEVSEALNQIGGSLVKPMSMANTYLAVMGRATRRTMGPASPSSLTRWPLAGFFPNYLKHLDAGVATPNDPYFNQQWGMGQVNMTKAWGVEKGSASVTVAVIDSGVGNHPDLVGDGNTTSRVVAGKDFIDDDLDPSNDGLGHGTFVAGIIAAQGDNGAGVCGVCWNGVNILPLRIFDNTGGGATTQRVTDALYWARDHGADVVNMSYGSQISDSLEHDAIVDLAGKGIILVASAGNDGETGFPNTSYPAAYQECIAVSAVGPRDEFAPYSSWGPGNEVDIAAPGGDSYLGESAFMFSTIITWPDGFGGLPAFGYDCWFDDPTYGLLPAEGTSFSSPHVAGAAALLLSAGVPASDVRNRLLTSARKPVTGSMDPMKYGAGILDVGSALSSGSLLLTKPIKGSTVTENPDFKITARGIALESLNVYLDYADADKDDLPDDLTSETPVLNGRDALKYLNADHTAYAFNWSQVSSTPLAGGFHFVYITATNPAGDETFTDWGTFTVTGAFSGGGSNSGSSNVIPRGTYLISLPYASSLSVNDGLRHPLPQELLWDAGTSQPLNFRADSPSRAKLIRWSALEGQYLYYLPGANDLPSTTDLSWVNIISPTYNAPTGGGFLPNNTGGLQFPAGSGFWLILQQDAVFSNQSPVITATAGLNVPLYKGWNLIGNPFARQVSLGQIKLKYHGETRTLEQDADPNFTNNPWIQRPAPPKSQFYGYSSQGIPGYKPVDWRGMLEPYQGYWVRALVGGNLPQDRLSIVLQ